MKRLNGRDALLMLAPVALLGALAWMLRARKPAVFTVQRPVPFAPFVKGVRIVPARPADVFDGYDTRVIVEFGAKGAKPAWWNKGFASYSLIDSGQLVRVKAGQVKSLGRGGNLSAPHLDSKSGQWIGEYRLKLRDIAPQSGQIRLRDTIKFSDNNQKVLARVWLDTPLRANGTATKMPPVSRVAIVKIESFTLDEAPPIESHDGIERWRAKWMLRSNSPVKIPTFWADMRVGIVNRKGEDLGSSGQSTTGGTDDDGPGSWTERPDANQRLFVSEFYELDAASHPDSLQIPPREPLWLQGNIRAGDSWPLAVRVPLRDANGKMLFTPRSSTVPFRVVSLTQVAPDADEVKEYGADRTVRVVMQAWNPKSDVSKWKWEVNYSQHLRTSVGPDVWQMPYKSGKSTIGASYSWSSSSNQMIIRYPLILKSVPKKSGKLVFHADIAANRSRRVPVEVVVRK